MKSIYIVIIYDSSNIEENKALNFEEIKDLTWGALSCYSWRLPEKCEIIFQLAFFDNLNFNIEKDSLLKEMDVTIKERDNQIKEKNEAIKEKDNQKKEYKKKTIKKMAN